MKKEMILGPNYEEMLNPEKIPSKIRQKALLYSKKDPLDPINLFNITWKDHKNRINHYVVPKKITGISANIVMLYAKDFPTGSHKVGPTYCTLIEKELNGEVDPLKHTLVWPSTGNYGIGGAWVGCRMKFDCIVVLPEMMSKERFDTIKRYGGKIIKTPGCESNVKEIYDKTKELKAKDKNVRVLNQFEEFGNYRFHYYVTGNTSLELIDILKKQKVGTGKISAFVSAMGSSGTIAAGDRIKQVFPRSLIVGSEPIQCPTLISNGYGGHDIQGIGDKHVTWIHNTMNMDAMVAVDDMESKLGLLLFTSKEGNKFLSDQGILKKDIEMLSSIFGISGICNLLSAIKTAKYYDMTSDDTIITIATDTIDRYNSVMKDLNKNIGGIDNVISYNILNSVFGNVKTDWVQEGTYDTRKRWHNLKYYTWIEQQNKTIEELNQQKSQNYWLKQQAKIRKFNRMILEKRRENGI